MGIVIPYIILCIIAGLFGRQTRLGFWGVLIISLLTTPIITLLVMFFLKESPSKSSGVQKQA
jgi:Na+/melibiose symporter-like transporter